MKTMCQNLKTKKKLNIRVHRGLISDVIWLFLFHLRANYFGYDKTDIPEKYVSGYTVEGKTIFNIFIICTSVVDWNKNTVVNSVKMYENETIT